MDFESLLERVKDAPVFESDTLLEESPPFGQSNRVRKQSVYRQLSRWAKSGRIIQARRGLYALAPPYRKTVPNDFLVGNMLYQPSYVSLEAALQWYNMIPEAVFVTTSVTTGRPGFFKTPLGRYEYRHVKAPLYYGYGFVETFPSQWAHVATPEKALLDLLYFAKDADDMGYLRELRLQNLGRVDLSLLRQMAEEIGNGRLERAVEGVVRLAEGEATAGWEVGAEEEFLPMLPASAASPALNVYGTRASSLEETE